MPTPRRLLVFGLLVPGLSLGLSLIATAPARAEDPAPAPAPSAPPGTLTKPPRLLAFVAAEYPPAEKAAGVTASVVLQLELGADGRVTAAEVTRSAGPAFDAAAQAAARRFVFSPAEIDGAPAPIRILYQYDFTLDTEVVAKPTAELAGAVRERATGRPLAGVTIALDSGERATTDASGRFAFDEVPPGRRTLTLSSEAITALATEETLEAGTRLDVLYDVELQPPPDSGEEADDLEIVVTAPKLERATASVAVAAGVARRVPGTGGDVLRVVESMPGVARAAAGSGQLVVWGAAPGDTRIYVDGVRVPRLYHAGGLRSVIAADLVRSIELVPGGWGAAHGRSLGGLVEVQLAPLEERAAAAIAVDAIDAAAALRAPITPRLRVAAAARKSHLAWLLDRTADRFTDGELSELFPIPRYVDGQVRLAYQPAPRTRLEAAAIGSSDRVTRTVPSADPARSRSDDQRLAFWRAWLALHRDTDDGAAVDLVVSGGADAASRIERFGATPTELEQDAGVWGVRASWRRARGRAAIAIGLDAELVDAELRRRGAITVPAREGDVRVFGQPPPGQLAADRWRAITASAAPYAVVDLALWGGRLHVVPGLRIEPYVTSINRRTPLAGSTPSIGAFAQETAIQPRLALRLDATSRLRLTAAAGRYRQPPQAEDLSAVFGNPLLPTSAATHLVAGAAIAWTRTLSTELTGFATRARGLAVRSPSATPLLAEVLEPIGAGRTIGAQALVRRELAGGVFGWVSYTLSRAERTDRPGAEPRRFDFDQTHVLTAVVSWQLGAGLELGARLRYATGAPRTAVIGTYYDARADLYQPVFGAHNADRLPAFAQLDARLAKRFRAGAAEGELYLDLQNATDRHNAEELVYSPDFTTRGTIRGLPILPVLGARLAW